MLYHVSKLAFMQRALGHAGLSAILLIPLSAEMPIQGPLNCESIPYPLTQHTIRLVLLTQHSCHLQDIFSFFNP